MSRPSFWQVTKRAARNATFEYFEPLIPQRAVEQHIASTPLASDAAPAPPNPSESTVAQRQSYWNSGKEKEREEYDRGRAQWSQYVEAGKHLIARQKDAASGDEEIPALEKGVAERESR